MAVEVMRDYAIQFVLCNGCVAIHVVSTVEINYLLNIQLLFLQLS